MSSVTLGKFHNLSESLFPHLYMYLLHKVVELGRLNEIIPAEPIAQYLESEKFSINGNYYSEELGPWRQIR